MKTLKVLLTGFEPFGGHPINPSWLAIEALPDAMAGCNLFKLLLPVSFDRASTELEKAMEVHCPDLVICAGLAEKRDRVSLERVAINIADARMPDNDGMQPVDQVIDYSGSNAYFSNMPLRRIQSCLESKGIPVGISETAGTYVCNYVMYRLLHQIYSRKPMMMGGFIHVPPVNEMFDSNINFDRMTLATITHSFSLIVEACVEVLQSGKWSGVRREIAAYKPDWNREFAEIAAELKNGLGDLALRIDHIGSTAVPGLAAKDIIDVQITVAALDENVLSAMSAMGYRHAEKVNCDHVPPGGEEAPGQWQKWYFRPPEGRRPINTHVRVAGRANQRYALLFRDYLRAHPKTAEAYGRLKMRLADNLANARNYPDVKDPAVDLIFLPAEKWAAETGWNTDIDLKVS
ncbi:MAG: pyroglutamyl-peptidase I [Candidatus Rifleibacteriota bacterium]